jgi:solute carrier family 25 (mitochondrial carnitine/acylcarnitine transporter), member 20/29
MLAGGLAGIAGWITTFPFDVIKTRIQISGVDLSPIPNTRHASSSFYTSSQSSLIPAGASSHLHRSMSTQMSARAAEAAVTGDHGNPHRGIISTTIASYRTEGFRVFWKGLAPTLLR